MEPWTLAIDVDRRPPWRTLSWPQGMSVGASVRALELRQRLASLGGVLLLDAAEGSELFAAARDAAAMDPNLVVLLALDGEPMPAWPSQSMPTVVERPTSADELVSIARLRRRGYTILAPVGDPSPAAVGATLTPREWDVLGRLAVGETNKEIARRLDLSEHTIRVHVRGVLKKLGISNRTQAALWYQRCEAGAASGRAQRRTPSLVAV